MSPSLQSELDILQWGAEHLYAQLCIVDTKEYHRVNDT
jgi:hypothetical protein